MKKKFVLSIFFIAFFIFIIINIKTDKNNYIHDESSDVSIEFPTNLDYKFIKGPPESGILIFLDNENSKGDYNREYILVGKSTGHLSVDVYTNTTKEKFITNQKVEGYKYTTKDYVKGYTKLTLILGDGFIGAQAMYKNDISLSTLKNINLILKKIYIHEEHHRNFIPEVYSENNFK